MVTPLPPQRTIATQPGLELRGGPLASPGQTSAGHFTRVDGPAAGFTPVALPPWSQTMQPGANQFAPLAAGDVNGDGWPDVVEGTSTGVLLYVNLGGRFAQQQIDFPEMRTWTITAVALVDLDGDGAPDLVFCAWMQGCHILFNRDGAFSVAAHVELPRSKEIAVQALAFGDLDGNGRVDVVTGPSSYLEWNFYPQNDVAYVWHNQGDRTFRPEALPGPYGETISLFLGRLNGLGAAPALYAGNDFDEPDRLFSASGGSMTPLTAHQSPFPYSTTTTMSFDTGDIHNDGKPAVYIAQIAQKGADPSVASQQLQPPGPGCDHFSDAVDHDNCLRLAQFQTAVVRARDQSDPTVCGHLADADQQRQCAAIGYSWNEAFVALPQLNADRAAVLDECSRVPADLVQVKDVCQAAAAAPLDDGKSTDAFPDQMRQVADTNLLFAPDGNAYKDVTAQMGVGFGGWTWNAKFADLDNSTWQGLFLTQGTRLRFTNASNIFYRNFNGQRFADATSAVGLEDHVPTGASLFLDVNMDGRLDVVTYPFQLTPVLWQNDLASAPGLQITLQDQRTANRAGIGARIEIRAKDGRLQTRDIKASGGYESLDEPVAHFGLGDWGAVASLVVTWPDGQVQTVDGLSLGAGRYTLVRSPG